MIGCNRLGCLFEEQQSLGSVQVIIEGGFDTITEDSVFTCRLPTDERADVLEEFNLLRCFLQILGETLPWMAVMMALQDNTNGICAVVLEQVTNKGKVAEGFTHFLTALVDHAGMRPEARAWLLAGEG